MASPDNENQQQTEALMNQGYEHLGNEEFEEALEVARKLEELQFTAAFEIAALAYDGMDDIDEALRVLHRGVEAAPDCWPNWELLGNYLSDLERYEEAEAAYEQALQCENVWEDSIRLNQAVLAGRHGRAEKAIELLDQLEDPRLELEAAECRILNLKSLDRIGEARTLAEKVLGEEHDEEEHGDTLARIAALLGHLRLDAGDDKAELHDFALRWLDVDPGSDAILGLLRSIEGLYAEQVRYYRLLLHAEIPEGHALASEAVGYFVTYDVVAESVDEALDFVRRFEDPELAPLLEIEEIEMDEDCVANEPKGVCHRSPMHLYTGPAS